MDEEVLDPQEWLKRAQSNLIIATIVSVDNIPEGLYLEDLCFEIQQCTEKAIKALLIYCEINFPKTHDIAHLIKILKDKTTIEISENIMQAKALTRFAVRTRYPAWNKISKDEYIEAIDIAKYTLKWVKEIIESKI